MIDYETYTTGDDDDILVMELAGRLDEHTSDFLVDCLSRHLAKGLTKIILDCSNLEQVSSFGLSALVRVHTRLKRSGGEVKLAEVSGTIADVLRIVHFDRLFNIYPTVEAAQQALEQ